MTRLVFGLIIISVTLSALAQICFKAGMSALAMRPAGSATGLVGSLQSMLQALAQPWVLIGLGLYAFGAMVWMSVLARVEVSVAYPFVALGFVVVMLLASLFFGESITVTKLGGTVLVGVGVWLIARG